MFGSHPMEGMSLTANSASAVEQLFLTRYNVRSVREVRSGVYEVILSDWHSMKVHVVEKNGFFGAHQAVISYVSE